MKRHYVKVAFFKGNRNSRLHKFIRWYTKSQYSHAELIMPDNETWVSISPFLSSKLEKRTPDFIDPDEWDFVELELHWRKPVRDYQLEQLEKFIQMTEGSGYDWIGLILSHLSPFVVKHKGKWYCSEWIAYALVHSRIIMWDQMNLHRTPDLSPAKLHAILSAPKSNPVYK